MSCQDMAPQEFGITTIEVFFFFNDHTLFPHEGRKEGEQLFVTSGLFGDIRRPRKQDDGRNWDFWGGGGGLREKRKHSHNNSIGFTGEGKFAFHPRFISTLGTKHFQITKRSKTAFSLSHHLEN